MATVARRTIDDAYAEACARLDRLTPAQASMEAAAGALVVDIRTPDNRRRDGIVPGSMHIPRTVLEWRVDIDSPWRNPHLAGVDQRLILLCDHGYSSALAASSLRDLGFERTTDVIGGFEAWRAEGLPTRGCPRRRPGGLEGAGPPD